MHHLQSPLCRVRIDDAALPMAAAHAATIGSGNAATETREASGFAAITLRGGIDLVVRQATREAVQVTADDNLLPLLQTTVEGSGESRTLVIQWQRGENIRTRAKTVVTVDVVRLTVLASSGSGDMAVQALKTPALALSISGSSDAKLSSLDSEELRVAISGSGDVQASGRANQLSVSISGSGDVRTRELAADDVTISIAGSGNASVQANKTLAVSHRRLGRCRVRGRGHDHQEPHCRQRLHSSATVNSA